MAAKEIITHNSIYNKTEKTRVCSASCKLDNYCISRIVVTEEVKNEKVEAYYISTHTKHTHLVLMNASTSHYRHQ